MDAQPQANLKIKALAQVDTIAMSMKGIASFLLAAALLSSCQNPPVSIENAKATITQNEVTKKQIKNFTDTNKKTQGHIKKVQEHTQRVQEEAVKELDALEQVRADLKRLLNKK